MPQEILTLVSTTLHSENKSLVLSKYSKLVKKYPSSMHKLK
ncbi:hypothetical protein [Sporosarcina globispora]|nr:hypothetical protein [Sporosarcina globispora]